MTRLPLVSLLAVLALAGTACSDDAEPTAEPTSESTTAEPTTEPTSEPVEPSSEPTTETTPPEPTTTPTPTPTETPTAEPEPSEPPVDPDAPPTTYDAARARFDATGQEPVELARFRTPNGTYCLLDSDFFVGCELPRGGIPDPDYCGEGPSENVGRIAFGNGGPTPECNSDTIREPGAPKVDLDTVAGSSASGVLCLVEDIGVTCVDPATTRGFFLGRTAYTVFNAG